MIIGQEKPDGGELRVGPTVELGYVDQNRDALAADKTVYEEISGGHDNLEMGGRKINSRAYVARFNFHGPRPAEESRRPLRRRAQPRPPGQAARAAAATCCCSTSRPTTSTSIRCGPWKRRSSTSPAASVVISHDRWFLDRIATHILAFEGDGYVHWCEGNFQTYEEQRRERLGERDQPHRFRYKKLQHG